MNNIDKSIYVQKAMDLFKEGYNCSQAVFLAFEDKYNIDRTTALMLSSSFGGGMGRLREVCGAVSGMFMVAGVLYGYDDPKDYDIKKEHQLLAVANAQWIIFGDSGVETLAYRYRILSIRGNK